MTAAATILTPCRALSQRTDLGIQNLTELASSILLLPEEIEALRKPDLVHPYGRRVLMASPQLEVMVATWTPGMPCLPHDHGGSVGAVRVLAGRGEHRIWAIEHGRLQLRRAHTVEPGRVLSFGANLIHSMVSASPDEPLLTLHLYTDSISAMVVYETAGEGRTLVVDGSCGAWVPEDPANIQLSLPGAHPRSQL